jgi:hypothetical protein
MAVIILPGFFPVGLLHDLHAFVLQIQPDKLANMRFIVYNHYDRHTFSLAPLSAL